jgi:Cu-Zn family superoxide dismutase
MNKTFIFCAVTLLSGCATQIDKPSANARLIPTKNNTTTGTVTFKTIGSRVLVTAEIQGLKPNAEHGFHVHEKGDCSSGDGMSTGAHFNPSGKSHGAHGSDAHHAGDLPSLIADMNGNAKLSFETTAITVGSGPTDIIDRGLIVHRDPDDYKTQPTGNSGPRLACAVIVKAMPNSMNYKY